MTEQPHDNGYMTSGWSTTVGELRAALEGAPDDTEVVIDSGDCEIRELHIGTLYPATPMGQVGLLTLFDGQTISHEYSYHDRIDAGHTFGTVDWSSSDRKWGEQS